MAFIVHADTLRLATVGVASAQDDLVREIAPHVARQLARYPLDYEDRRDVLQTTLMRTVRSLRLFRGDAAFSTWLFRVTANEALMLMRSRRNYCARFVAGIEPEDLDQLPVDAPQEAVDAIVGNERRDTRIRAVLDRLPHRSRDVILAHYHEDLELEEIAVRLKLTESTVRSRLHRARKRMKRLLNGTPELSVEAFAA